MHPKIFQKLIENFASLPTIGPRMAERLVLFLFRQEKSKIREFAQNLNDLEKLQTCQKCFNVSEEKLCPICLDPTRDQKTLCVVEEPLDIVPLEKTRAYAGLYYVLGGLIFSAAKEKPDLKINQLLKRIREEKIQEVIIATNPTTEGDATALYLRQKIEPLSIKITRLGRGLSTGGDIEYADEATLKAALTNRQELI